MKRAPAQPSPAVRGGIYFLLALLAVAFYLAVAYLQNGAFGFPLDDAWIHQVYARNLGTRFEFSFFAGQPSAGSTSPLWALLLSVGYALHLDFRVWTIGLGIAFLGASALMTQRVTFHLTENARVVNWFAPLFLVFEWHLVWAAASGMEIVLFVFLALALVEAFFARRGAWSLGLLAGLLTLTRPEGMALAALIGGGLLLPRSDASMFQRVKALGVFAALFAVALLPYLAFNLYASGTILPNTFYAKTAEYAALTQENFFARWLRMYRQPLIGAQLLLVPGFLFGAWKLAREKKYALVLPAAWIILLPLLYAWRLPVEYQFGRYLMPVIPFIILYGLVGTELLFQKISLRLIRRVWGMTIAVLLGAFYLLGANFYAQSVAVIQCEMVAAANWTRENLPAGQSIAAHDIGAQAYFDARPLLDLAGLVSPEVIPFMRDETKLLEWMRARGARYAVFFPTWYPQIAHDARVHEIFSTDCATTRGMGEENLRVYEIR
ncbi:hypothetical protein FBQ82_11740 [Anaerolineae bacterium CFX7]|nr:hypothetical protein [Anaerolineae bacterium CFX7]